MKDKCPGCGIEIKVYLFFSDDESHLCHICGELYESLKGPRIFVNNSPNPELISYLKIRRNETMKRLCECGAMHDSIGRHSDWCKSKRFE